MIDVFIRTTSEKSNLRSSMFDVSWHRWDMEPVRIRDFVDYGIQEGRLYVESQAQSDPYIVTDDDVLIVGRNWVERTVSILLRNPDYAVASTLSLIESENMAVAPRVTPVTRVINEGRPDEYRTQGYDISENPEIYEMHAVGAPMLIRKGFMADLPEMDLGSECSVIHQHLLSKGKKEGLLDCRRVEGLRHIHMGHGFSSNPALFWGV